MSAANGTATFWKHYAIRNGYVAEPTTSATGSAIEFRLHEAEERLEIAAEWLVETMARVDELERRIAS